MTWDRRLYFPYEGRRAEDFFALKNPTALAGFEPANLGTKGQHATSRPPKPLSSNLTTDSNNNSYTVRQAALNVQNSVKWPTTFHVNQLNIYEVITEHRISFHISKSLTTYGNGILCKTCISFFATTNA